MAAQAEGPASLITILAYGHAASVARTSQQRGAAFCRAVTRLHCDLPSHTEWRVQVALHMQCFRPMSMDPAAAAMMTALSINEDDRGVHPEAQDLWSLIQQEPDHVQDAVRKAHHLLDGGGEPPLHERLAQVPDFLRPEVLRGFFVPTSDGLTLLSIDTTDQEHMDALRDALPVCPQPDTVALAPPVDAEPDAEIEPGWAETARDVVSAMPGLRGISVRCGKSNYAAVFDSLPKLSALRQLDINCALVATTDCKKLQPVLRKLTMLQKLSLASCGNQSAPGGGSDVNQELRDFMLSETERRYPGRDPQDINAMEAQSIMMDAIMQGLMPMPMGPGSAPGAEVRVRSVQRLWDQFAAVRQCLQSLQRIVCMQKLQRAQAHFTARPLRMHRQQSGHVTVTRVNTPRGACRSPRRFPRSPR